MGRFWSMLGVSGGAMGIYVAGCMLFAFVGMSVGQATEGSVKPPNVQILLALRSSAVCLKTPELQADLVLVNRDDKPYVVDVKDLNVIAGYTAIIDTSTMQYRSAGMSNMGDRMGPRLEPVLVAIPPGGAYSQPLSFSLQNTFFSAPGFYSLMPSISIGKLTRPADPATAILFQIRSCES